VQLLCRSRRDDAAEEPKGEQSESDSRDDRCPHRGSGALTPQTRIVFPAGFRGGRGARTYVRSRLGPAQQTCNFAHLLLTSPQP
jgi:hypothetical protein